MCINGPKKVSDTRLVQISMKRSECGENIEKLKIRKKYCNISRKWKSENVKMDIRKYEMYIGM